MKKIVNILGKFMSGDRRNAQLMQLAKTEYGKDWEYAYHCLLNKKQINPRFTQGIE